MKSDFLLEFPELPIGYYSSTYPLTHQQIRKHNAMLDWCRVRNNQNIKWSIPMIDEFRSEIENSEDEYTNVFASWLSFNQNLDWDMEMVKYYEQDLRWESVVYNPILLYDREFFLKYSGKIEPHLEPEMFEDLDRIMLRGEMTRDEIVHFFNVNDPFIDYATAKRRKANGIPDDPLESVPSRGWKESEIIAYAEKEGWRKLSAEVKIIWTKDLLSKFKEKLTWKRESEKSNFTISESFDTFWTTEMINEFSGLLDFRSLSYQANVEWSFDLLYRYKGLWDNYWLATNDRMWEKVFPEFISDEALDEILSTLMQCYNR